MALVRKETHVKDALARLAQQLKGKPGVEGLLSAFVQQAQELEDAAFSILDTSGIETAYGAQLDRIGALVGQLRGGDADIDYRDAIKTRITINVSSGTLEELIRISTEILGGVEVEIRESFPAEFDLVINDPLTPNPASWQPSTPYDAGDRVSNFGNVYLAIKTGVSAASGGPLGLGAGIVDNTVTWNYAQPGVGERAGRLVLTAKPAGVRGIFWWHESATPFVFDGDPDGLGFGAGEFSSAISLY